MTQTFQQYYTDGVNHHNGQSAQLNFFIRSSALTRAFLLAKAQVV
jgi:hypothetical protein